MRVSLTVARKSLLEFGSALVRACNMFVTLILGLLIVVIFDLFSNSILVLFSTKKCSNGGKNERE